MILPADLSLNQLLSAVAVLLYAASALLGPQLGVANSRRMLSVAWGTHAWAWVSGLMGIGDSLGPHFGFAPALSVTCWLVMAFYALEQRWVPQVRSRGALGSLGAAVVLLTLVFPGKAMNVNASAWLPLHWAFGLASYGLFGAAVVHAGERQAEFVFWRA